MKRNNKPIMPTYGKLPPQAPEIEKAILGAIMLQPDIFPEVFDIIPKAECFYVDAHCKIYEAVISINIKGDKIDLLTVTAELIKQSNLEYIGGAYYLTGLTSDVVSGAHVDTHAKIVMEKYMQRELIRISGTAINDAYEDSADIFDLLDRSGNDIANLSQIGETDNICHILQPVKDVLADISDLQSGVKKFMGVDTGIYELNQLTKGWQSTDLIIIAARPSQGKSALALEHVIAAAMTGVGVALFSLEMGKKQMVMRLIANHSRVELEKIKTGQLHPEEQKRVNASAELIAMLPIYIDDMAGSSIQRICNKIKSYKRKGKIGLAAVDYLQLSSVYDSKNKNREQQIAEMSRCLKVCAKDAELPIICLSQMNRGIEQAKRKPMLSDLRESGAIEQDADMVIFIHHDQGKSYLVIAKNRNGICDDIEVVFLGAIQKFISPHDYDSFRQFSSFGAAITKQQSAFGMDAPF